MENFPVPSRKRDIPKTNPKLSSDPYLSKCTQLTGEMMMQQTSTCAVLHHNMSNQAIFSPGGYFKPIKPYFKPQGSQLSCGRYCRWLAGHLLQLAAPCCHQYFPKLPLTWWRWSLSSSAACELCVVA